MKRDTLIVITQGFKTGRVFSRLFPKVEHYHNKNQIKKNTVVVFEGGTDIQSRLYSQVQGSRTQWPDRIRDAYEIEAFQLAMKAGAACIGICRGAQLLTALNNGSIIQDVTGHHTPHLVETKDKKTFEATSCHHQMMNPFVLPENKYEVLAWAAPPQSTRYLDGHDEQSNIPEIEPEIVYYPQSKCLCVQGHPEWAEEESAFCLYCRMLVRENLLVA